MAFDFDAWARSDAARRFQCFDPYMTYAKSGNDRFVRANGKPGKELNTRHRGTIPNWNKKHLLACLKTKKLAKMSLKKAVRHTGSA